MQISKECLDDNKIKLDITIDKEDVDKEIANSYHEFAKKYKIPGFRKGKAPRQVINSQFGKEVILVSATNQIVNACEPKVYNEADIVPLGDPDYEEADPVVEGENFTYSFTVEVRPKLELENYDPVSIYLPDEKATDEEVDLQIEQFRGYYASIEEIKEDRGAQESDIVELTILDNANGDFTNEDAMYEIGSGQLPEEFDENLKGMKPEETKDFSAKMNKVPGIELDDDTEIPFTVTVNKIKERVLPEVTDEFAEEAFGMDSVEEMRETLKEDIETQKSRAIPNLKEQRVLAKLSRRLQGEPSDAYVESVQQDLARQLLTQLSQQGLNLDTYLQQAGITTNQLMSDLRMQAEDVARESLALDALVRKQEIEATEDDVKAQFTDSGVDDPDERYQEFLEAGQLPSIREFVRRMKVIDWLLETAEVTVTEDGIDPEEQKLAEEANKKAEEARDAADAESEESADGVEAKED